MKWLTLSCPQCLTRSCPPLNSERRRHCTAQARWYSSLSRRCLWLDWSFRDLLAARMTLDQPPPPLAAAVSCRILRKPSGEETPKPRASTRADRPLSLPPPTCFWPYPAVSVLLPPPFEMSESPRPVFSNLEDEIWCLRRIGLERAFLHNLILHCRSRT